MPYKYIPLVNNSIVKGIAKDQLMQSTVSLFLGGIGGGKKKKERFDTILEPLQAILQVGFLTYCPIGTKIAIHNNCLIIQSPGYTQQVSRWYNNDTKEDLVYLFNVFSRFSRYYHFLLDAEIGSTNHRLYTMLIKLAKSGIDNLIRTYNQTAEVHLLHTLQMFKNMLEKPAEPVVLQSPSLETRRETVDDDDAMPPLSLYGGGSGGGSGNNNDTKKKKKQQPNQSSSHQPSSHQSQQQQHTLLPQHPYSSHNQELQLHESIEISSITNDVVYGNIDNVFIRITELYSQEEYNIIYNTLMLIQKDEVNYKAYMNGLNQMMEPLYVKIKKWLVDNVVF